MKKSRANVVKYLLATGFVVFTTTSARAATISGLYNTGVDDNGVALPIGSAELHYSLTGPTSPAILSTPNAGWIAAPEGSAWIGPSAGTADDPSGDYEYTLTFDLKGLVPSTAVISGLLSTDNSSIVLLNGSSTSISTGLEGFKTLTPFTISEGFTSGLNTLEFVVNNEVTSVFPNPTGILIADMIGTAAVVPIPAAVWLFGSGMLGLIGMARRKKV